MVQHLISVTEWARLTRTPSDAELGRMARNTLYAAEMRLMDRARDHPLVTCGPVGYTLAIIVGAELTCRDEPEHKGIVPLRAAPLSEADRAEGERLWQEMQRRQQEGS